MNDQEPKVRRLVFRPLTMAIQSLSLATAASVLLWTLGGGLNGSAPVVASAATKADKAKKSDKDAASDTSEDASEAPLPSAIGRGKQSQTPCVKLNYFSAPWEKVLMELADASDSELVMDHVPRGRFNRRDKAIYTRHDACRIINKEIEPLGFRIIEKGDFLLVLQLHDYLPKYQPATLPAHQPPQTASTTPNHAVTQTGYDSPTPVRRVESITRRRDPEVQNTIDAEPPAFEEDAPPVRRNSSRTRTASEAAAPARRVAQPVYEYEDAVEEETPPVRTAKPVRRQSPVYDQQESVSAPASLKSEQVESQAIFRPRHRAVVDLSRQLHQSFSDRSQQLKLVPGELPAFQITTLGLEPEKGKKPVASAVTISIDTDHKELLIDGPPKESDGVVRLLRMLDRPHDEVKTTQLTTTSRFVCQVAHQLPAEIERIRAARRGGDQLAKVPADDQRFLAQNEERPGAAGNQGEMPDARAAAQAGVGDRLGNLRGEVSIEAVDVLGALIIKGNAVDIEQVIRVIKELERLSEATAPKLQLHYLKHVDSESIATLLTSVYERLTKFPGPATQPRQSAAVLPISKPNSLLIIAPEGEIKMIEALVDELDQPVDPLEEFQVFVLKHAIATQVEEQINALYAEPRNLSTKVLVIADPRANSIIVRAQPRDLELITALIRKIDRDDPGGVSELRIFPLKNAIAAEMAMVLNAAIQSVLAPPTANAGGGGGGGGGQFGNVQGLGNAQIDEQFRITKSLMLQFKIVDSKGERDVRSGILSDIRITPDSRVNTLIVSATEQSMSLIAELIKQLDRPTSTVSEIKVFTLANADAEMMVQQLNALFNNQPQGQGAQRQQQQNLGIALAGADDSSSSLVPMRFSIDKRTNSVIAIGARDALGVVEAILLKLDESDLRARQNVVIRLQNSQATLIAQSIQQFYQSQRDISQADPNLVSSVEQLEKEVVVVPDATNNSLLLSATPRYFKNIENMILRLDAQPRQVIIQAMLVEVELDNTDEFGIELGLQDPVLFNRSVKDAPVTNATSITQPNGNVTTSNTILSQSGSPGFNFNNPGVPLGNNLATLPATVAGQALTNFNLGRVNSDLGFGGLVLSAGSDAVNVLIRALSAHRKITVLSRPQIRALDNQQAEIFSGQQIPIINGFTANGTTGVNTPTIQQQMAGIQLQVMPRITADGNVVMMLYAQRSQYRQQGVPLSTDATGKTVSSPILDISRLTTTISVPNGNTVVIGGLINTRDESFSNKAPFLSDIPLVGNLFRYDSRSTRRVELLMFLTPRVLGGMQDEEMIKEIEFSRLHIIQAEIEDIHGPLLAVPACPPADEVFNNNSPLPSILPPSDVPQMNPQMSPPPMIPPQGVPLPPPPVPTPGINLPPAPLPKPTPNANPNSAATDSTIYDSAVNPVTAQASVYGNGQQDNSTGEFGNHRPGPQEAEAEVLPARFAINARIRNMARVHLLKLVAEAEAG